MINRSSALSVPMLQWSRNFFVTERSVVLPDPYSDVKLQWAVTFSLRKAAKILSNIARSGRLQWGRNFFVTERDPF